MFFFKYLLSFAKSNQQGMALALVTILVAVMALSSLSIFYLSSAFNQGSFKSVARQQTQFAAEAGLQKGLRWLEITATISGHWSMSNHFNDPIQFNESLTEKEEKCLGSFGYHNNFVHFVHHMPLKPMIEGEIENYFNYVVIQKIAEEFQYLETSGEETIHSEGIAILEEFGAPSWTAFTLELWIKSTNGEKTLFELSGDDNQNQIKLERLDNNGLRATIGTGSFQSAGNIELANDEYQHVVLSWSRDVGASFYVNIDDSDNYVNDSHSSIAEGLLPEITIPSGDGSMNVDRSAGIEISGLRLWNTKRSNTQIFNNVRNFIKTNDNLIVSYYFDRDDELTGPAASKKLDSLCQGGRCRLVHDSVEKSIQIINLNEELDSMHDTLDEHYTYTRVPETSYFKIMSCGLGPLDTMVSMESIMKFEKFNDISAIKVGEKFL